MANSRLIYDTLGEVVMSEIDWDIQPDWATHYCTAHNAWRNDVIDTISGCCIPLPSKQEEPRPMPDNCLAAKIGEVGNQVHNLGCEHQNDEDLSDRLGTLAIALWDLAGDAPKQPAKQEWEKGQEPGRIEQEWDGGLPPAGIQCECYHTDLSGEKRWVVCDVVGPYRGYVICAPNGGGFYGFDAHEVRPLKSQHERRMEELVNLINHHPIYKNAVEGLAADILSRYTLEPKPPKEEE